MLTESRDPFGSATENTLLRRRLAERIEREGPISFHTFMELVAHDPDDGYYATRSAFGPDGDFVTSPQLHPIFGALLARQLEQCWQLLDRPAPFRVVEQGAGSGRLARALIAALPTELARVLSYTIVEAQPAQAQAQRLTLGSLANDVGWDTTLPTQAHVVLSNELIDSFPVHRVVLRDGVLRELLVGIDADGAFIDVETQPTTPRLPAYFAALDLLPGEGCQAEVNLDALDWMREVAARIEHGFVLTLDYGYPAARLYAPWRRDGTLLCFFRHTTSTDPYSRIGRQDITAHVDFTALARAGGEHGLTAVGFASQQNFLGALGIGEALAGGPGALGFEEFLARRRAVEALLDPEGLGRIRVLAQAAGFAEPPILRGFAANELELLA
jgi:SAM-dependent MidA family methyltransferase